MVAWSLDEGPQGGAIDAMGNYQAPLRMGTFHVRGRSYVANEPDVVVPITVGPTELSLFAGQLGGEGTADDIGKDARFSSFVNGITAEYQSRLFVTSLYSNSGPNAATSGGSLRQVDLDTGRVTTLTNKLYRPHLPTIVDGKILVMEGAGLGYGERLVEVGRDGAIIPIAGNADQGLIPASKDGVGANAQFNSVRSIAPWGHDELLVMEAYPLRRINLLSGEVSTIAQSQSWTREAGWKQLLYRGNTFYVIDHAGRISSLNPADFTLTSLAKVPRQSLFSQPVFFPGGRSPVFFTGGNASIEAIYLDGRTEQFTSGNAGDLDEAIANAQVDRPTAFWATDTALYFFDAGNLKIRALESQRTWDSRAWFLHTLAGARNGAGLGPSLFTQPEQITVATNGDVVVVENGPQSPSGRISWVNHSGDKRSYDLGYKPVMALPIMDDGIAYLGDRFLVLRTPSPIGQFIYSYVGTFGEAGDRDGVGAEARFGDAPKGLCRFGNSGVLVADTNNNKIRSVDTKTLRVQTVVDNLTRPESVAYDGKDAVFVAEARRIVQYNLKTKALRPVVEFAQESRVTSLAWDPAGLLYLVDQKQAEVRAYVPSTGELFTIAGHKEEGRGAKIGLLPARLNVPTSVAYKPDHSIVISDTQENAILQVR